MSEKLNKITTTPTTTTVNKDLDSKKNKSSSNEMEVQCNLENEFSECEEKLVNACKLSEEELALKDRDIDAFWKMLCEKLRVELSETLETNAELCMMKDSLEEEYKELRAEEAKLIRLTNQAAEINNDYMVSIPPFFFFCYLFIKLNISIK
jgi:hypothetical protein